MHDIMKEWHMVMVTNRHLMEKDRGKEYGLFLHDLSRRLEKQTFKGWGKPKVYTLCRDIDLPFSDYIHLCQSIGSSAVLHGGVIRHKRELEYFYELQLPLHIPTQVLRKWIVEKGDLWNGLQELWQDWPLWSTVHDEEDISFLKKLSIPKLSVVLISPIFPTPCKIGHTGIGIHEGMQLYTALQPTYGNVKAYALGGISKDNMCTVLDCGFSGVAMMSGIYYV